MSQEIKLAGHVQRMQDDRYPKKALYGELVRGKRRQGGPKMCYKDTITAASNSLNIDTNFYLSRKVFSYIIYTQIYPSA